MKIHKTVPKGDSDQWRSDAPSVKAMRSIIPITALLSAISLSGGIISFLNISLSSSLGIASVALFFILAYRFDKTAMVFGQSVVRESILKQDKKIEGKNPYFLISLTTSAVLCIAMGFASFSMSKDGISYLVKEARSMSSIESQVDTTLSNSLNNSIDQSSRQLDLKQSIFDRKVAAINSKYEGKISSLQAEKKRREAQRDEGNTNYIDKKIAEVDKKIGEENSKRGSEIELVMTEFEDEQNRLLAKNESIDSLAYNEHSSASILKREKEANKAAMDEKLSGLVSSIFAWSIILMLLIGVKLTFLETRNDILPNPVLDNSDLSGQDLAIRFVMTIPNFIYSYLLKGSELLYRKSPKRLTPMLDNNLIDFKANQYGEYALNKFDYSRNYSSKILNAVADSVNTKSHKDKIKAWDLIQMYLQTTDHEQIEAFYTQCVEFVNGGDTNPFHVSRPIGFLTQSARVASYNATRYESRKEHGFSDNKHGPRADAFCQNCGDPFKKKTPHHVYCDDNCRFEFNRKKNGHDTEYKHGYKHKPSLKNKK